MKNVKKYFICFLMICFAVALPISTQAAPKASIKLNKTKANVYVGKSLQLKATVKGKSKKIVWKSSNRAIATVSSRGKVTAKKAGRVRITAKANGKSKSCVVTVKNKKLSKKAIRKAYQSYFKRNFSGKLQYPSGKYAGGEYILYDINHDGTEEMIFRYVPGIRYGFMIFTCHQGKVVKMFDRPITNACRIYEIDRNTICIQQAHGAYDNVYTYFRVRGTKLKKVVTYRTITKFDEGNVIQKSYKNGKRISNGEFDRALDTVLRDEGVII